MCVAYCNLWNKTKQNGMKWKSIFCENMKIFIISWNTDFHSTKYRFSFHKIQISQRTNFHFVLFNFILQITVSYVCEYNYLSMYIGWVCQWFLSLLWEFFFQRALVSLLLYSQHFRYHYDGVVKLTIIIDLQCTCRIHKR